MRRLPEVCIAVAASAALVGCGPDGGVQAEQNGFSSNVTPELKEAFTEIDTYWEQTRGLGETGLKLVMVDDRQRFTCVGDKNVTITASDESPASYCRSNKTIAVSRLTWQSDQKDFVKAGGKPADYTKVLIGHEYGHGLQQIDYERLGLNFNDVPSYSSTRVEQQADCADGMAMKGLNESIPAIDTWFDMVGDHPNLHSGLKDAHGLASERKAAYLKGQEPRGNCDLYMLHTP